MNVKLLEQVRDCILAYPANYDQGTFCGTACCIAGHAVMLSNQQRWAEIMALASWEGGDAAEEAGRVALDLTENEAMRLFDPYWDDDDIAGGKFDLGLAEPGTKSIVAAKRINHFIKTGGAE